MNEPTKAQLEKLPQWAQKHISDLEHQRNQAVGILKKFMDGDTPSGIYTNEHSCIGEDVQTGEKKQGVVPIRHYIQAKRILFDLPRSEENMEVFVNDQEHRVELRFPRGYPLVEPVGGSSFYVHAREDFYLRPNAQDLCRAVLDRDKLSHDEFVEKYGFSQEGLEAVIRKSIPKSRLEKEKPWR